jgi:hypothetical protein
MVVAVVGAGIRRKSLLLPQPSDQTEAGEMIRDIFKED